MSTNAYFKFINVQPKVENWVDSIIVAAKPLLQAGCITQNYIDSMINNVKNNGTYIVIMPNVALPHTRSEEGALKTGLSILKLEHPVMYPDDKPVQLVISFSANDNTQHMELLSMLAGVLMDETKLNFILNSNDLGKIEDLFIV